MIGRQFILRINIMKHAKDLAELMRLPGLRCHALKGSRKGQHSIALTDHVRLIFSVRGNIATIEEVSKHYD